MDITFYNDIENIFTQQRLSVFKQDGVDEITCVARYLYNIEICKSLYPSLHIFEITLRNVLDKALADYYNVCQIGRSKRKSPKRGRWF